MLSQLTDQLKVFFTTKDENKFERKTIFKHMYLHALAKLATAEGFLLKSLSVWVRRLTAELFASAINWRFPMTWTSNWLAG